MNPLHYRDMIVRAVAEPNGKTLDLIVNHVIDAERAKQILRANGYGMTGLSASATAALVPAILTRPRVVIQHAGSTSDVTGASQFTATDAALVQAVREWDALCATQAVPRSLPQNP